MWRKWLFPLLALVLVGASISEAAWRFNPYTKKLDYYQRGVDNVTGCTDNQVGLWDNTLQRFDCGSVTSASGGDVTGGAASADGEMALYNGTGGKTIKRSLFVLAGPSATAKTYTFPNASSTVLTDNNHVAGTNYLAPNGSAAALTSFPTLNQNTTGTAAGLAAAYTDWNAGSGGASVLNKPTLGTVSTLTQGTMTNGKLCSYASAGTTINCNSDAAGTGTVTGPATATQDNLVCWGADNVTIKDCGSATSAFAPSSSTSTATDWNKWDGGATGLTAATGRTSLGLSSTDNVTFNTVTATEFVSSAADNTRGVTVPNTADPTGANLAAGKCWVTDNTWKCRSNDNTATFIVGSLIKSKSFGWDNAATTDNNIFLGAEWSPVATTLISIKCFASADNVIGVLSECASDNNASCTKVDDTDWTITNAVTGVTVLAADFENAAIAAGASLKWTTTSVGSALNRFSCTVRYRE